MASENVDVMRRITTEGMVRHNYQAVLPDLDPAVEIDDADIPESTGADSFLSWLARWDEAWESWRAEDIEIRGARDEQVIALFTMVAKGNGSGIEVSRHDALVASFRHRKVVKIGYFSDQTQALKAVGMEE